MSEARKIESLVEELVPVRPASHSLYFVAYLFVCGISLVLPFLLGGVTFGGPPILKEIRPDFVQKTSQLYYDVSLALLFFGFLWSGWTGFKSAVPGQFGFSRWALGLPVTLHVLYIVTYTSSMDWLSHLSNLNLKMALNCSSFVLVMSFLPLIAMSFMVTRLAALRSGASALFCTWSALFWGSLTLQVYCPMDGHPHRLFGHGLFVLLSGLVLLVPLARALFKFDKSRVV
jgi:hypothetical protein